MHLYECLLGTTDSAVVTLYVPTCRRKCPIPNDSPLLAERKRVGRVQMGEPDNINPAQVRVPLTSCICNGVERNATVSTTTSNTRTVLKDVSETPKLTGTEEGFVVRKRNSFVVLELSV